jgi:hypothetical protein
MLDSKYRSPQYRKIIICQSIFVGRIPIEASTTAPGQKAALAIFHQEVAWRQTGLAIACLP